jgi:hypothetical protein
MKTDTSEKGMEALSVADMTVRKAPTVKKSSPINPLLEAGDITASLEYAARQSDHPVLHVA